MLVELVELEKQDLIGKTVRYTYEIYKGDWVSLIISSANPYWHTREWWLENYPKIEPVREAKICVTSDGGLIGYWETKKDFYDFARDYLRAKVIDVVFN